MFFNSQMCYHGLKELPNIFCATVSENVYCYPFGKPRKSCCLKRRQRFTLHWQYPKYTPQELLLGVSYWGSADLQLSRSWDPNEVTRKYPAIIHTPQLPSSAISTWWNPTFQPWIACKLLLAAQHFSRGGGGVEELLKLHLTYRAFAPKWNQLHSQFFLAHPLPTSTWDQDYQGILHSLSATVSSLVVKAFPIGH